MPVTAKETASYLRAREALNRDGGRARATRLLAHLRDAKQLLLEQYGAARVWLFGSLAAGEPTPDSDVYLAVQGLASNACFYALAELTSLFRTAIDLVRMEEAPDSLRERILAEGREL